MDCHETFGPAKDVGTGISARQGQTGTSCVQGGADHGDQCLLHRGLDTSISLPFRLLYLDLSQQIVQKAQLLRKTGTPTDDPGQCA